MIKFISRPQCINNFGKEHTKSKFGRRRGKGGGEEGRLQMVCV